MGVCALAMGTTVHHYFPTDLLYLPQKILPISSLQIIPTLRMTKVYNAVTGFWGILNKSKSVYIV